MKSVGVYTYGGSGNHGCEALLRTLNQVLPDVKLQVFSQRPYEDLKYLKDIDLDVFPANKKFTLADKVLNRLQGEEGKTKRLYSPTIKGAKNIDVMISIGGDNYCYDDYRRVPGIIRKGFTPNTKTILMGCSINEEALKDKAVLEDLKQYDLITAREKLTYNLLKNNLDTRIEYYPDSAFILNSNNVDLPSDKEYAGLNLSPMILNSEKNKGSIMNNAYALVDYILSNTDMSVMLVPHVIWAHNDDRTVLKKIYDKYKSSGRVILIDDENCCNLKGYISRCRFFIGARTHATIAAYSSAVPTIVLGYSIKSKGIAMDLFGSDENYVIPVQEIKDGQLVKTFVWLMENEDNIKNNLRSLMPEYKIKTGMIKEALESIF